MNTECISTQMSTPEKVGETKHSVSSPLQKVGGMSTLGSTPMNSAANQLTDNTIQFVSMKSQQTPFSSLKTNFCCF